MSYVYFNQNNYPNTPYPGPGRPQATVKSSGCGPTSMAMIIANLLGIKNIEPVQMAAYSLQKGARNSGGTDLNILAKAVGQDYGLTFQTTSDEKLLMQHLAAGNMAIANVGGNRPGYIGVFSDGGHYVVAAGLTTDHKVIILDPGYYVRKFNKEGRAGKVTVQGAYCICDISVLAKDTENRSPAYWLFSRAIPKAYISVAGKVIEGYLKDGRTYGPAKDILSAINTAYTWDASTSSVVIRGLAVKVTIQGGKGYAIAADLLMAAGRKFTWDATNRTVIVR